MAAQLPNLNPSIYTRPVQHSTCMYTLMRLKPITTLSYYTTAPLHIYEPQCMYKLVYIFIHSRTTRFSSSGLFFGNAARRHSATSTSLLQYFYIFTLLLYFALPLHFYIPAPRPHSAHDSCWPMQKAKSWGRTGVTTGNARKQQPSAAFLRRCTTLASTDRVRRRAIMVVCVPEEVSNITV